MESQTNTKSHKKNQDPQVPASTLILEASSGTSLCNCPCSGHGLKDADPLSPAQLQAAGFLAIFSCFVLVEGATRTTMQVMGVRRYGGSGINNVFSPGALLAGALLEVIFGALGLILAMGVLLYGRVHTKLIMVTLFFQLLGLYTLVVFTIVSPAIAYGGEFNGLSAAKTRFLAACGIIGYFCYCAVLQGGQMFFTWKILSNQRGNRVYHTVNFYRSWLLVSAVLLLVAGLMQWWIGAVALHQLGGGRYNTSQAFITLPYVVFYPGLSIFVGLVVTCGALYAIYNALTYRQRDRYNVGKVNGMLTYYVPVMLLVWLVQLSCMGFVQSSYAFFPALTAMLTGLTFLISALPVIFDAKMRTAFPRVPTTTATNLEVKGNHTQSNFVHNNNVHNNIHNNDSKNIHNGNDIHTDSNVHIGTAGSDVDIGNSRNVPTGNSSLIDSKVPTVSTSHNNDHNKASPDTNLHNSNHLPPNNAFPPRNILAPNNLQNSSSLPPNDIPTPNNNKHNCNSIPPAVDNYPPKNILAPNNIVPLEKNLSTNNNLTTLNKDLTSDYKELAHDNALTHGNNHSHKNDFDSSANNGVHNNGLTYVTDVPLKDIPNNDLPNNNLVHKLHYT